MADRDRLSSDDRSPVRRVDRSRSRSHSPHPAAAAVRASPAGSASPKDSVSP